VKTTSFEAENENGQCGGGKQRQNYPGGKFWDLVVFENKGYVA
jgi:hypothetical protein